MRRARAWPQRHHRHSGSSRAFSFSPGGDGVELFYLFIFLPSALFFSSNVETQLSYVHFLFHIELLCSFQRKMQ